MKLDIDINEKYEELKVTIENNKMDKNVSDIIQRLETTAKLAGKKDDTVYLIQPEEVVYFYSLNSKIMADTLNDTYELKEKLYQLEDLYSNKGFVRLSKYAIANIRMIKKIEVLYNGSLTVHFKNGQSEDISRRNISKVKKALGL